MSANANILSKARSREQIFPPNSLPKLHALQSTVPVSQYLQTVKTFGKTDTKACKYLAKKPCSSERALASNSY